MLIRTAASADAADLLEIYRPYVVRTTVSFETEVPTLAEFSARIARYVQGWAWVVAEEEGRCAGYAYASDHRARAAYRFSVETSAYVHASHQRRGLGKQLYLELFAHLRRRGFCNAYAGIAQPNEASMRLHQSVGFEPVGIYRRVGWKFEAWHDVAWLQRPLLEHPLPGFPRP